MRSFAAMVLAGAIVAAALVLTGGRPGMAQQPVSFNDISQSDFEAIDSTVRRIFEPLKKGDSEKFKELFVKQGAPGVQGLGTIQTAVMSYEGMFGNMREIRYVRHEFVKNVTDYYVFYYADLRETALVPWEIAFYRVKGGWKIIGVRTESGSPVEFFKFSALQYRSFKR